jgi:hypothetical protein
MDNNNTVKNELPELLSAVCNHDDCPEWLKDAIWDTINDKTELDAFAPGYFREMLGNIAEREAERTANSFDILDSEVIQ